VPGIWRVSRAVWWPRGRLRGARSCGLGWPSGGGRAVLPARWGRPWGWSSRAGWWRRRRPAVL